MVNTAKRFRQYLQIIPPNEREAWIFATLGILHYECDKIQK